MSRPLLTIVFFLYGLAFYSMGTIVLIEGGRGTDRRLRLALRPLAAFGILHGIHEWQEMFELLGSLPLQEVAGPVWEAIRLILLAFSFLSLSAFGVMLMAANERVRRITMLLPLGQVTVWVFGLLIMRERFAFADDAMINTVDVWTRYVLGIPSGIAASLGLVVQQRIFRRAGMVRFGRDSLWAAVAFAWYGLLGQIFTRVSLLPLSQVINQNLFLNMFGFPVQLMRATAAMVAATFVIRFLRAFEVETQRQIDELQAARVEEAERRETLRGELLRRVVSAQEAERQRIARELHDETGQALTAAGLGLRGVATLLKQDPKRAAHHLNELEKLVTSSLTELQRLIADLRPSHLDDLGLAATLRWWAGEVEGRGHLKVPVKVIGKEKLLAGPVRLALFRVTQEALTNVIKHADATQAVVKLMYGQNYVRVSVSDDGRGFNVKQVLSESYRPSWGLLGMNERAALLDGTFTIDSAPNRGTTVTISIPYQSVEEINESEGDHENQVVTS